MEIKSFLIAGGNPTDLVWNCPVEKQLEIARKYLSKVEQVGFISTDKGLEKLTMMGNELCVDAMLALAYDGPSVGELLASSVEGPVLCNNDAVTTINFHLPYIRNGNVVLFNGIGYVCTQNESDISRDAAVQLARQYNLPAFGQIYYQKGKIAPSVYVAKMGSFIHETGCGSGSIAVGIVTGWEAIIQPSGYFITVRRNGDSFEVAAKVTRQLL
jgi:hypothetical protein